MRVLNDNVLVSVTSDGGPRQTASGLYVPETVQEGQVISGTVIGVGEGKILQTGQKVIVNVLVGEKVWFPKFNASKIDIGGQTHYVVSEQYILAAE
jgi:chaperonin GroES